MTIGNFIKINLPFLTSTRFWLTVIVWLGKAVENYINTGNKIQSIMIFATGTGLTTVVIRTIDRFSEKLGLPQIY